MNKAIPDGDEDGPCSLLNGVPEEVAALLAIKSMKHSLRVMPSMDGTALVKAVYARIRQNYENGRATLNKDRSRENWRWPSHQTEIASHNTSPEIIVERAVAKAAKGLAPDVWGNQVPVASGLIAGAGDSRRAIDLVRRHAERHFELIELKIGSDTPLYAAIEILGYGCLWLLARQDPPSRASALLEATRIDLSVLAPRTFYAGRELRDFERTLDEGVRALGAELGVEMSFRLLVLDPAIDPKSPPAGDQLLNALASSSHLHAVSPASADYTFLPGVPRDYVLKRIRNAGGKELESGKFASPESSASLAANAFGWFVPRPELLPRLPGLAGTGPARKVELEFNARFPWRGGTHPWLDAVVFTDTHLIGVESKRFEPFRDVKEATFSAAYERHTWGEQMARYCAVRRALSAGSLVYTHLDAAQLIKHAYGLVTTARDDLKPALFYVYAEPTARGARPIPASDHARHRQEIADFAARVAGDEVAFLASSYREWLATAAGAAIEHRSALHHHFDI